jgi:hypothetical protein
MSSRDDSEPVLGGVRLEQHAGVTAALADGIAVAEVLAQEGIDEAAWATADRMWVEALASSPDLTLRYMQRRRQAEDALARSIQPLDEDPSAWAGLIGALAATDSPQSLLEPLGLKMTDIGRLGRHWKRKAEEDPEVVRALTESAGHAPAPQKVTAAPILLRPFPWSPPGAGAAGPPPAAQVAESPPDEVPAPDDARRARLSAVQNGRAVIELDSDLFAAVLAVRQVVPEEVGSALSLCGVDEARFRCVEDEWQERMAASPDLRAAISVRMGDHRDALRRLLAGGRPAVRR